MRPNKGLSALLCLLLLCQMFAFPAAQAGDRQSSRQGAMIRPFDRLFERVRLRERPNQQAKVLGQYFGNTRLDVLEPGREWSKVRIGRQEGYMMSRFLQENAQLEEQDQGYPGAAYPGLEGLMLYEQPNEQSKLVAQVDGRERVSVIGTVGGDWLQVIYSAQEGEVTYGFVDSRAVTMTDNFATVSMDPQNPRDLVPLLSAPKQNAPVLARYFAGTTAYVLFDDHVIEDGFERLRVGSLVGYVKTGQMDTSSGGGKAFLPPLSRTRRDAVLLDAPRADRDSGMMVEKGERLMVLGWVGDDAQVKLDPAWDGTIGFLKKEDIEQVAAACDMRATLKPGARPVVLTETGLHPNDWLKEIYPDGAPGGEVMLWDYVDTDMGLTLVSFEEGGRFTSAEYALNDLAIKPEQVWE